MRTTTIAILLLAGCEVADPTAGGEQAWVMVEESAAVEGWRVHHADWLDAPALPTDVNPDSPVLLRSPRGEETGLDLSPGYLARVRAGGAVEVFELGVDAPNHRLIARGREAAVRELADVLDAEVTRLDGIWVIEAEGLFELTSFLEVPEGIDEIGLDLGLEAAAPRTIAGYAMVGSEGERAASLVGMYAARDGVVMLDAEGGFHWTIGCFGGERTGRVVIEDQRIVLVGDDGVATPFAVQDGMLVGDGVTLTNIGDQ
jgi:hypothetical protein